MPFSDGCLPAVAGQVPSRRLAHFSPALSLARHDHRRAEPHTVHTCRTPKFAGTSMPTQLMFSLWEDNGSFGQHIASSRIKISLAWNSLRGSRVVVQSTTRRTISVRKLRSPSAFWSPCSRIASCAFTCGTVAVLPFYSLMVLAPNARLTRKSIESSIPYIILGVLYAYLLYLSWTPDTLRLMFASKYWLPELPGIAKMFSSEMTLASAWIHLLVVDLFAARQIFHDGLKNNIQTRHSVSLCLLFCPIGILMHAITKALTLHKKVIHGHEESSIS